jgi:hypothetical protein
MKIKGWSFSLSACFIMALFFASMSTSVSAQGISQSPPSDETQTAAFALADLTGIGDIVLSGSSPSYSFFIPVPVEWKLTSVVMHLSLTHSKVLRSNSTITLQINNVPVESLQLISDNIGPYEWDVNVPSEYLNGDVIFVSLIGFMRVSDNVCDDIENAANWTRIASQSTVLFSYEPLPLSLSLNQFPYPFVRTRSLTADKVLVIIPDDATGEEMSSVFDVASSLGSMGTWRGLSLSTIQEMQFTNEIKSEYDAILVGTVDRLKLASLGVTWSLRIDSGKLVQPDNSYVPDTSGAIMIAQSPWNPDKAILAVTGFTPAAVTKAALAIRNSQFANLVRGQYAIIPSLPEDLSASTGGPDWANTDFSALGYSDQTVNGIGEQRISIPLNLPNGVQPKEIKVKLVFSHSPFVSTDRSFIVLSVNGIPQAGLYLKSENENRAEWTVTVPAGQLMPGKNKLEVMFDLHMTDNEICTDDYYDQAWAVLHRDSTIRVSFDTTAVQPDFMNYPSPFGKDTLVIVSSAMGEGERSGIFQLISHLGALLGEQARYLEMVTASQVIPVDLIGHSLIIIGLPDKNSFVADGLKSAPVQLESTSRTLKTTLFDLTIVDGQPIGLIQEIISPWDATRSALIITGTNDQGMGWATGLLSDQTVTDRLRGNIAIVDGNGGLTLVNSFEPASSVSPVAALLNDAKGPSERTLSIVLIGALVVLIAGLIFILVRRRVGQH